MSDDQKKKPKGRSRRGRSKRRRQGGGSKRGGGGSGSSRKRRSRRRRGSKRKSKPKKLLNTSSVDTERPADEDLTPSEVADMRRHLRFIDRFRSALRIKLNAHEDLLVNGAREPTHRGRCKHLLSKVDRSAVSAALAREPLASDKQQRVEFLAGAAAITGDAGVLLSYLESLTDGASRDLAARAFAETVEHIDFEALSPARMARLLEIVESTFEGYAKVQAMFGLLQSPRFRRAFDASVEAFDKSLTESFVPLRAVWQTVERAGGQRAGSRSSRGRRGGRKRSDEPPREALEAGLRELLDAPPKVLSGYSERARERLLEVLVTSSSDWPYEHPGVRRLLESFPDDGALFRRHAFQCARGLVTRGHDKEARKLLARVADAHPGFGEARHLLDWLERPAVARFAIAKPMPKRPPPSVHHAFSLESLTEVWLRWGQPGDASRLQREADLHGELGLPGITPCLGFGISDRGTPWVAADATLPRLVDRVAGRSPPSLELAHALAQSGLALLRMLAAVGVTLPDARSERFLVDLDATRPSLELVDLGDAERTDPAAALAAMTPLAGELVQAAFRYPAFKGKEWRHGLPNDLRSRLGAWARRSPEMPEMAAALRTMGLNGAGLKC